VKTLRLGPREAKVLWSLVLAGMNDAETDENFDTWSREDRKVMARVVEKVARL
jgi:hypothetical protein